MYNIPNDSWELDFSTLAEVSVTDLERSKFELREGDILMSRVNSFELVGKTAYVNENANGFMFENMLIRVRLNESADPLFVAQQLRTKNIRRQVESVAKIAIGQSSINSTDIRGFLLRLPTSEKQNEISRMLTTQTQAALKLQTQIEQQITEIEALPAAYLRQAFSGAL